MDIKMIRRLIKLLEESSLSLIEIETNGQKVKLVKKHHLKPPTKVKPSHISIATEVETNIDLIQRSALVGKAFLAPALDAETYVRIGTEVKEGDVLCHIETLGLVSEVLAEINGVIAEVLITDGQKVEFDQPLFIIQRQHHLKV